MAEKRRNEGTPKKAKVQKKTSWHTVTQAVVEILGNDSVRTERLVTVHTQKYIRVKSGEKLLWKNPNASPYAVVFEDGLCPYDHTHNGEICRLEVPPNGGIAGGRVKAKEGETFDYRVRMLGGTAGTPKIIIQ